MKKIRNLLVLLVAVCAFWSVGSVSLQAAGKPKLPPTIGILYEEDANLEFFQKFSGKGVKGIKVELSDLSYDKTMIDVWAETLEGVPCLGIYPVKPGKTTLRFKASFGKGRIYNYSIRVNILKYSNPVSTLKIGEKNYAFLFSTPGRYVNLRLKKATKKKIQVRAKQGWKLISIKYNDKKVRNNSKVKVGGKGYNYLSCSFKNKFTKVVESTNIYFE